MSETAGSPIELRLDYQRLNTFFADYAKNISRGGTFINTSKPLPVGTRFVFVLGVPHVNHPLRLDGRVMWVTRAEDASKANPAGMGIEIEYASDHEKQRTRDLIEQLMSEQLGARLTQRLLA